MSAPSILYFAYGMNCNTVSMALRCADSQYLGLAVAQKYRLDFNMHCDISADPRFQTLGALWLISASDQDSLDIYEGFDDYYGRSHIDVWFYSERRMVQAMTYQMQFVNKVRMPPMPSYLKEVTQGYETLGLPLEQLHSALIRSRKFIPPNPLNH